MEEVKGKVCVTGASGYIASWIVKELLQRGYTVNATIRDRSDLTKTKHLKELKGAEERLHLFKANLIEQGSFDAAIAGCEGVFHTASPVVFNAKDPQVEVLDPAVKGILNVLNSCKKFPTVRRVIFTSSLATSLYTSTTLAPDVVVDETWISNPEFCKGPDVMCYVLSKVLSEEAAFKFAKENNIDLVSINPGMVIGPMLQPTMNDSVATIFNLINVEAHIRAFEIPSANGRYVVGESVLHFSEVLKILHDLYPNLKLPQKCADAGTGSLPKTRFQISNSKVKQSLGITEYIPFEVGLRDTIVDLKNKNYVNLDEP